MPSHRLASLVGALVFLVLALLSLYRLLVGFPMSIGGHEIGQASTFFAFAIFAALTLIMLRGIRGAA